MPPPVTTEHINSSLLQIYGTVQGVGFRPFVYRLAKEYGLTGWVKNTGGGVEVCIQGEDILHQKFIEDISLKRPSSSIITKIDTKRVSAQLCYDFVIEESQMKKEGMLALLPDTALCPLCKDELFDPSSRRYQYPFIHCCTCGPRFSLFEKMPFDRSSTTMRDFPPCPECLREYHDPSNRRFFSQTTCCPTCGPHLTLHDSQGHIIAEGKDALSQAQKALREKKIVAVKNTAGFLLLTRADEKTSVEKLRRGKRREKKPFAILVANLSHAKEFGYISEEEEKALTAPMAPIVLVTKKEDAPLAVSVCEDSPYVGLMLAHSALLTLLMADKRALVATSGNISDEPLCIDNETAFNRLGSVADLFLCHNRRIIHRLDDSIVSVMEKEMVLLRRARGFIPTRLNLPSSITTEKALIAYGAELKNTFSFALANQVYVSQHMGSLSGKAGCDSYLSEIASYQKLLNTVPESFICDRHPDYFSTRIAQEKAKSAAKAASAIPHHRAHVYACMLDRQIITEHMALCWDGIGLGEDDSLWGAESFVYNGKELRRFASFQSFPLPGGQKAVKEPRRALLGLLFSLYGRQMPAVLEDRLTKMFSSHELSLLMQIVEKNISSPLCSSIGRLFDALSALLGLCYQNLYEGHAALSLEGLCLKESVDTSPYPIPLYNEGQIHRIGLYEMVEGIASDIERQRPASYIAKRFVDTLCYSALKMAKLSEKKIVLLTGGVMQNRYLVKRCCELLKENGFTPLLHKNLPPGDGNISAGQILGYYLNQQRSL